MQKGRDIKRKKGQGGSGEKTARGDQRNRGKKGSKRHKYEWNSEKNIPNSLCELPKLETARDYDFLVWKEKSFHSIWGK